MIRALATGILAAILLSGCNPFGLRDAEKPDETSEWHSFPINVDEAMDNLSLAYGYRQNLSRYSEVFSEDFVFVPDAQDVNDYDLPASWNRSTEYYALSGLWNQMSASATISLTLSKDPDRTDNIQASYAELYRVYSLTLSDGTNLDPGPYQGRCYFYLEDRDGLWRIVRWNDYRTGSSPTWGHLKYDATP